MVEATERPMAEGPVAKRPVSKGAVSKGAVAKGKAAKRTRLPKRIRSRYLNRYALSPDVVFDVGVFNGTGWLYNAFPKAKFVLIDPQAECAEWVQGRIEDFDFHAVALGAAQGRMTLNIPETKPGKGGAMASMLTRSDRMARHFTSVKEVDVPVERLDDIAAGYDGRVGLKIDTEGFESQVLAGGAETLKRADFVILEMSVAHRFQNTAPPSALIAHLAAAGLEFRDILAAATYAGKRPVPQNMDVLFTRWAT